MTLRSLIVVSLLLLVGAGRAPGAALTSPKEHFGFAIGDDYHLANYTQTEAYFKKLAAQSDRLRLVDMGRTEEGRSQWMVVATAPENLQSLERYKSIAQRLARAEDLTPEQARALAAEGKAVVWIDGGLHATETVGSHQLFETVWHLASSTDAEMQRILRDVIVLCVHANPDGQELVANWYMREPDPTKRSLSGVPRLYQKYIGHDNNRDFFMAAMRESTNLNRQLYLEWFPQVVYNHHQSGPAGTVMFVPPFRDPFNYNFDPLVVVGVETFGNAIQSRFLQEGKPGATSRSGANYSTWWNGGLRTTTYFHNMIGLLTEIVGSPNPIQIPFIARRQQPSNDLTAPIEPQRWHYRQSIEYSLSANRAILDQASRHREVLLHNIYLMGRNSIARGSRDAWTFRPGRLDQIVRGAATEPKGTADDEVADAPDGPAGGSNQRLSQKQWDLFRKPEWRDPRGFIIPADQPDFGTAVKFLNTLVKNGIALHRATADFSVAGKRYPKGSYIVKTAQAFRPHVLDMFEPQDHPNDFRFEGGPPNKPYDVAGWTLAFQMGVGFDRILDGFDGPFERLPYGQLQSPPPRPLPVAASAGHLVTPRANDSFTLVNRLLKAGVPVHRIRPGAAGAEFGPGTFFVPSHPAARALLDGAARDFGLEIRPTAAAPAAGDLVTLAPARVGLWDRYGGSMPSGWTRFILEQFEFPFQIVFANEIDAGKLREKFDVLLFVTGAIPAQGTRPPPVTRPRNLPPEFESQMGRITGDRSVPALKEFLQAGGTIVTIGSSTSLAYHLGLPVQSALTERNAEGRLRTLPDDKFYIPGSVLEARVDPTEPVAWGMPERADFYFERSPAFTVTAAPGTASVKAVAWFDSAQPLRSGWAWGQKVLKDRATVLSANVGSGRLYLMGSEIAFRSQTHGTFKLLFNALQLSTAIPAHAAASR
jgi:hypothetical protein